MRIGLFTNAYRPIVSGVVNSVDLIRRELLRQGHTPYIFAPHFSGYRDEHAGVWRYPSLNLSPRVKFPLPIPLSCRLESVLRRAHLDVVHTHHPFLLGEVARRYARNRGVPLVFTFHTQYELYAHYIPLVPKPLVRRAGRFAVARFARECDLLISPSPSLVEVIRGYGLTNRLETLPNAIEVDRFATGSGRAVRRRLGLAEEDRVALYAGRMASEKSLDRLIDGFCRVAGERARLVIVGDGFELKRLREQVARLGAQAQVRFAGRVDYREMPDYYAAADLFAMTSTSEVKPLAVLEAMAAGLPVVAVAACGTADTITHEHDGLLCENTPEAIAAMLDRALTAGTELRHWGEQARRTAAGYGVEAYTRRLVDLYQEVREGSPGRGRN